MKRGQYAPQPSGFHAESAIPLVLIAILAIFLAAKFNILPVDNIPILNQIMPSKDIKVGIFGRQSDDLKAMLASSDFQGAGGIAVRPIEGRTDDAARYAVRGVDVIILTGDQYCDRTFRKAVTDAVKGGKSLIVIGDACTKVRGDNTALGWSIGVGLMGDIMPVEIGGLTTRREPIKTYDVTGQFRIINFDHTIFQGIKDFPFAGSVTEVVPTSNADVIAQLDTGPGQKNLYLVVEGKTFPSGKVLYFAFDPAQQGLKEMFKNTLLYVTAKRG
ncbi:MAG: hypothetical protein V1722_01960 [Candidatus Micrarchaeota archaeon]